MSPTIAVIGAGIAGASAAYWISRQAPVIVLERESQPGYHATGRSAAMYVATYGPPTVRALTAASRAFYQAPPPGFCDYPLLTPRGVLHIGRAGHAARLAATLAAARELGAAAEPMARETARERVPVLRDEWLEAEPVYEPGAEDMDVHALHQGYLKGIRRHGGSVRCDAEVVGLQQAGRGWRIVLGSGETLAADIVVNAAGAWCDRLARLAGVAPLGLVPKRRSVLVFAPPPHLAQHLHTWPAVIAADESFYFKPDAGMILASPTNADATGPQDVQPEELDIALAIQRIEEATTLTIRRPARTWAGLRSFVADGEPVIGFDPDAPGFFWLAGQGGYGIQSADGAARAAAALVLGQALPDDLVQRGVTPQRLSPARLRG